MDKYPTGCYLITSPNLAYEYNKGYYARVTDRMHGRVTRIPSDWGLEVGILSEVFRNVAVNRICQTELCNIYDHKHQPLSPDEPEKRSSKNVY